MKLDPYLKKLASFYKRKGSKKLLTLIFIFLLGFFLRVSVAYSTQLWGDESISVYLAREVSFKDLFFQNGEYFDTVHPSGYYLLLKLWLFIGFFDDNWIRTLSLAFFPLTLLVIYKLGREVFNNKKTIFLVLLLFAVHPLLVNLGYQARPYALTLFFCSLSMLFLLSDSRKFSKSMFFSAFFLALASYFDYLALWLVMSLLILSLVFYFIDFKLAQRIFNNSVLSLIFTFPQLLVLVNNYAQFGVIIPGSVPQDSFTLRYFLQETYKILGFYFENNFLSLIFLLIFLAASIYKSLLLKNKKLLFLGILSIINILLPILFSVVKNPVYLDRNLSLTSILWCFILANCLIEFFTQKKFKLFLIFGSILFLFFIFSLQRKGFLYQSDLEEMAKDLVETDSIAIFIADDLNFTFKGFYFPKFKVKKEQLFFLDPHKIELSSSDKNIILSDKSKYILYSEDCLNDATCFNLKNQVLNLCENKQKNCVLKVY